MGKKLSNVRLANVYAPKNISRLKKNSEADNINIACLSLHIHVHIHIFINFIRINLYIYSIYAFFRYDMLPSPCIGRMAWVHTLMAYGNLQWKIHRLIDTYRFKNTFKLKYMFNNSDKIYLYVCMYLHVLL